MHTSFDAQLDQKILDGLYAVADRAYSRAAGHFLKCEGYIFKSQGPQLTGRPTMGQDCQKSKETSSHLADKQQKRGEHVENIKFR